VKRAIEATQAKGAVEEVGALAGRNARVVVFAATMSHPRYHRRVAALIRAGFDVTVYSFRRGYYRDNAFPQEAQVIDLGPVADGAYARRLPVLIRAGRTIRKRERKQDGRAAMIYAFGLDNALVSLLAGCAGLLVYEVGDLRNPEPRRNVITRVLWRLEQFLLRRAALLVATSPAFITEHYDPLFGKEAIPSLVLENKIPSDVADRYPRPAFRPAGRPLRIGVIGMLRYEATLAPLLGWVGARPDYELHIHGDGPLADLVRRAAADTANVHSHGPFRNPEDLSGIYGSIDVCYCVYDSRDRNVRLALPNKLFEAPYFGVPLVVAAGTALASRVEQLGIGVAVDPGDPDFLAGLLSELAAERVDEMKRQALRVPTDQLVESHERLIARVATILAPPAGEERSVAGGIV
jgi:succinoglycan biosynthesis protein ExoL